MAVFKRKISAPGPIATVLDVVVGVLLGATIAAGWLVLKPVGVLDAPPVLAEGKRAPGPHDVLYIQGSQAAVRASEWAAKERAYAARSERGVELTERDVNRWFSNTYGPQNRKVEFPTFSTELTAGVPIARFDGAEAEFGLISDLVLFGNKRRLVLQSRGSMEKRGDQFVFVPSKVYVGSLPVPAVLGGGRIFKKVAAVFPMPEEARASWLAAKDVAIEGGKLEIGF